ncbi:MAG: M23 family metallopeptidase [Verrucomicrobia bacterium]|nr:M23 family metallopeptidase [Verrucomicrobiota bacterium]
MSGATARRLSQGLAVLLLLAIGCGREKKESGVVVPPPEPLGALTLPASDLYSLTYPTRQTRLADTNYNGVYQPTGSGNPESGTYGSVRLGNYGKQILPRFHEGLDIAALERDRQGRPLDDVFAAANGTVALVHRTAGNSDYGIYVVLLHNDPVGEFYTLYAHMAEADASLREGAPVTAGTRLGRMGNTALSGIPMSRAHLHFEIGLVANSRFLTWPGLPKKYTPGGKYNGQNLWGLNPILVFRDFESHAGKITLLDHIQRTPTAIEVLAKVRHLPDCFVRHPLLWTGPASSSDPIVLSISEGGVVLAGRPATAEEAARLGKQNAAVLRVNETALGKNARRIAVKRNGHWVLGSNGENWLSLWLY